MIIFLLKREVVTSLFYLNIFACFDYKKIKMLNIGITIHLNTEIQNVWENGIIQNVVNFYHLLKNADLYNVYIVNMNENVKDFTKLDWKSDDMNIYNINDIINGTDLIIMMGSQIPDKYVKIHKQHNGKIVNYYCGNHFIIEMENCLFKSINKSTLNFDSEIDGLWMIPQLVATNQYYLGLLHRQKSTEVPFIWDSYFIDRLRSQLKNNGEYKPLNDKKRISTFEPNINVCKYAMYPIMIYEKFYRESQSKDKVAYMSVTNSFNLKNNAEFVKIVNHFDIVKHKKIYFESRHITPWFLSEHTDIVIEHQWENPLNYLYLDVAYLGYPLIHNAHIISDLGYYYNGWNVDEAAKSLEYVINKHDENMDEYKFNTEKVLNRYRPTNNVSIDFYIEQINKLFR